VALCSSGAANAGLLGTLYGTDGDGQTNYIFTSAGFSTFVQQGDTLVNNSQSDEYAIAVGATIRTLGNGNEGFGSGTYWGAEYTLSGVPTGATYTYPVPNAAFYDGTTDGTYNYAADYISGNVYSFNLGWTNPQLLFNSNLGNALGISYDSANNSLWVAQFGGTNLTEYSLSGLVLSSFSTAQNIAGLAYNPGDDTLWFNSISSNTLYQYSTAGSYLGSQTYAMLNPNILGLEFAESGAVAAPEPTTFGFILSGIAILWAGRSRCRRSDR